MPERPEPAEGLPQWARDFRAGKVVLGGNGPGPPATPRQMLERGYEYHAYCQHCDESRRVDLQRLVRMKQGDIPLARRRLKCKHCGGEGSGRLKAPVRR